ncbi:MAG: hypothetical protein EOL87_16000 [Spartobacteria bacterium]|nr:hypothetical protein [Spartobacteria bacterium]
MVVPNECVAHLLQRMVWFRKYKTWKSEQSCAISLNRLKMYSDLCDKYNLADCCMDYLEFGVFEGCSLRRWLKLNHCENARFIGFDTFVGLPEQWDWCSQGHFSTGGKEPEINDKRCSFIAGLFQNTLQDFLKDYARPNQLVVHIDCDLFSASLYVLICLGHLLREGDIIVFDEFDHWMDEFHAYQIWMRVFNKKVEAVHRSKDWAQVAFVVQ